MTSHKTWSKERLAETISSVRSGARLIGVKGISSLPDGMLQDAVEAIVARLDEMPTVDTADTPANGEVLTYDSASGKYKPSPVVAAIAITDYQYLEGTLDATLTQAGNTFEVYMPGANEASLQCNVLTAGAGELRVQYSTNGGTSWNYLSATGNGPSVSTSTTGLKDSGWLQIANGAKTSVRLRLISINGTGAAVSIDDAVVRIRAA